MEATGFKPCTNCRQDAVYFARSCAAKVCDRCGEHQGLARCFCGWAADGGDGRVQLIEAGETIEEDA